ncbi:MAG: lipoprotein [Giesbergeria sp.]|nr:lipoprotein [Simplicispira sp.]MBP6119326.1 lipoprotein [Giesbergeria sp.]MBP6160597.1 lipoprotein [Giesbergeria sp.]MBP7084462.1 lipoprotein [Giesbergeria sp.]MBP9784774.1 lipoprotein [Giesbergeria sp.]
MLIARQILVRTLVLAASGAVLAACGQRGPLFLPTEAAASQRASLPQTLLPTALSAPLPRSPASSPP